MAPKPAKRVRDKLKQKQDDLQQQIIQTIPGGIDSKVNVDERFTPERPRDNQAMGYIEKHREFRERLVLAFYRINQDIQHEYAVTEDMNLLEVGDSKYFSETPQGRARFLNHVMWHKKDNYPKTRHFAQLLQVFIKKSIPKQISEYLRTHESLQLLHLAYEDHVMEYRAFRVARGLFVEKSEHLLADDMRFVSGNDL